MNRTAIAYHEAGHAVVALSKNVRVRAASIRPGGGHQGYTEAPVLTPRDARMIDLSVETPHQRLKMENLTMILLAGPIAQRRYAPRSWRQCHGASDHEAYSHIMLKLGGSGESLDLYCRLIECWAKNLVDRRWWQIEKVAAALLDRETLTLREIRGVLYPELGGLDRIS